MQKSSETNVLYSAGVWPTYLFVAGSIILLQCLSMIHKTVTNLRNNEIWRLLLLEQIPTFGELDDKNTGPNHWKRNNFTWNLLQKCAVWNKTSGYDTLGAALFLLDPWTKQSVKEKHDSAWAWAKCLINFTFLVSTNASWFNSFLRTASGYDRMDKNCFNSHC